LREHHLVDIREEEEVNEREVLEGNHQDNTSKANKHSMAYASGYMKGYLKGYAGGKKAFWNKSRE
jgi:hypothetical protein